MRRWQVILTFAAIASATYANAGERSASVKREFQREHPCPSTGKATGACPGWERDHKIALCNGGPDAVSNLQWLTVEEHRRKSRAECKRS